MGIKDILDLKQTKAEEPPKKKGVPKGIWSKCAACNKTIYQKDFLKNLKVCPECGFHYQLSARERLDSLVDPGTFEETNSVLLADDPLKFKANKTYRESLDQSKEKTALPEAVVTGWSKINGRLVMLGVMDFHFIGGTMGSVVGEKITRAVENATEAETPLIIVAASGGARMQEGMFSLMQMAKTSAAIARLGKNRMPYITVLTHPTTGGVTASFASLADVIIGEPGAMIGFTGPRVIEQTIKQRLPEGFQTAEFMLEHGMIDMVIERPKIKNTISDYLDMVLPVSKKKDTKEAIKDIMNRPLLDDVNNINKRIQKGISKIQEKVKGD